MFSDDVGYYITSFNRAEKGKEIVLFRWYGSHGTGNNSITATDLILQNVFTPALPKFDLEHPKV
jgi:hypothetical protein